ncbi:MAG: UV DNA damage repair endonuclease UvsE [Anaeromicrobium sp.]|jgi:UV DNA damage endonuclease|uniref:UV DNA damage repair endonuclease UvsE n=1 Tax=Anaeromicrobium sp. TaxID=1929132 RepID=UPI0025D69992|nr:UV DNA damage repair endonuclease UvsE [Anaeromicrobium sp.]MCT4595125.1 UV DNA damage repair endonuclease UvsE [Anaeromicrobium sp.]
MIKRIGYACINTNLKPRTFKDCRLNSVYKYGIEYLRDKIIDNLILIKDILRWNMGNNIFMYRVTSRLLPLVTHPDMLRDFNWRWQKDEEILRHMEEIKIIVGKYNIRLSMHPDQFTVINSLNENVVRNSVINLQYHYEILEKLGGNDMIIHTGGVYGNKEWAIKRFIENYNKLSEKIKGPIRLENDDKSYNIDDVIYISSKTSIPIVLDIHHHNCNNTRELTKEDIIRIKHTWKNTGLNPKIHISSGKNGIKDRKHDDYIKKEDLLNLLELIGEVNIDLMVEAKKKDEAALKVIDYMSI